MRKGTKRLTTVVTAQTHYNLLRLADMAGYRNPGRVIDKLVRDHLRAMRGDDTTETPNKGGNQCRDKRTDPSAIKKTP